MSAAPGRPATTSDHAAGTGGLDSPPRANPATVVRRGRLVVTRGAGTGAAEPAKPEQAQSERAKPERAKPQQAKPEQVKPEAPTPEQAEPEMAKPEPKRTRSPATVPRRPPTGGALPTLRDAAAAASVGSAAEAAHLALAAGGSAVDAVVAGFFAAAGSDAGVLLGSAAALVAHAGSSARAFDGRPLQPGKGAQRPRGLLEGAPVPDAARVAVPRVVPMLQLLHAYGGRSSFSSLGKFGADAAAAAGSKQRAAVLRRVGAAGVIGLRSEGVYDALLAAGNSVAGGALTEADLDAVLPADADPQALPLRGGGRASPREDALVVGVPWAEEGAFDVDLGWVVDVVAAADARGGVAVLSFAHAAEGVPLPAVGLVAPRVAVPVRRGVTRVTPGATLRVASPIGVARFGRDLALAFGLAGAWQAGEPPLFGGSLDAAALASLGEGGAVEPALGALAQDHQAARAVAAVRAPRATRSAVVLADAGTAP